MNSKYKVSPQQENEKRIRLKDELPLNTPLSIQIELASSCNFHCCFCMHGNPELINSGVFKTGLMSLELFQKIVNDLKQFPKRCV